MIGEDWPTLSAPALWPLSRGTYAFSSIILTFIISFSLIRYFFIRVTGNRTCCFYQCSGSGFANFLDPSIRKATEEKSRIRSCHPVVRSGSPAPDSWFVNRAYCPNILHMKYFTVRLGFAKMTPVQAASIPLFLQRKGDTTIKYLPV